MKNPPNDKDTHEENDQLWQADLAKASHLSASGYP
jgi:hypothetical protein